MANKPSEPSFEEEQESLVSEVLFDSIGEGAVVIDRRGNIARVNKIAEELLGYAAEELIGQWYPDAFVAENEDGERIPTMERPILEVFLSGKPVYTRLRYRKKDGDQIAVALTVSPVMAGGKPIGAIELFRDITEELQLEHAKDEFISIASHQLRTPATVVKQYLGMVLDGYVNSPKLKTKMLKLAYEHNENQLTIINELLQVAQAEAHKITAIRKKVDLIKLIQDVLVAQEPEFNDRQIDLRLKAKKSPVFCTIDPLHIQMVFENLINNANKYSSPGGKVIVCVEPLATKVKVLVKDTGIGIDEKDIPKLFKKFSRAQNINSTASGTGLGLYWAKKLVELHKGSITVTSRLGHGSTFVVTLPLGTEVR